MQQRTWQEIEYCFDMLRATNSARIEVYYIEFREVFLLKDPEVYYMQ